MRSFDQANHFIISNLTQIDIRTYVDHGFKILQQHTIAGASHDAGERYDAPKCHPETRKAVLSNIMNWVNSDSEPTRVMWLYGAAGAGKSAIAQTIAEECHNEGKLAASFFLSRFGAGRNKKDSLVATIAFQLSVSVPATKETQMTALVVEPFNLANTADTTPRLIILDGLDECEVRKDQAEIIEAIAKSLSMDRGSQLRVLLASRPEVEIRQAFDEECISSISIQLALNNTFDPDKDIELFLRS
ncbi:hypothetical protein BDQ17DRAFT_1542683 [Cyathus striatus]|nr:hypothetical protein BDQ17DRAFT_1542683 [Cyathus striatus]